MLWIRQTHRNDLHPKFIFRTNLLNELFIINWFQPEPFYSRNKYVITAYGERIFTSNGDYLFMFSEEMNQPLGICITQNRVLVTQVSGNCIKMYEQEGKLIKSVVSKGSGEAQFNNPIGLSVSDTTNNVYVCDYSNNRVQIFTEDLKFHSMLGIRCV